MKKMFAEFKAFISRGNVLDMTIGGIIASAFGKITTSLVNDVLLPFISLIFGARDMTALNLVVREAVIVDEVVVKEAITIGFGTLVGTIVDFILIALVVFAIVKAFNKAHEVAEAKKKAAEEAEAVEEEPEEPKPTTEELLAQILEEIKKN